MRVVVQSWLRHISMWSPSNQYLFLFFHSHSEFVKCHSTRGVSRNVIRAHLYCWQSFLGPSSSKGGVGERYARSQWCVNGEPVEAFVDRSASWPGCSHLYTQPSLKCVTIFTRGHVFSQLKIKLVFGATTQVL